MAKSKTITYDLDQIIESYSHNDVIEDRMEYTVEDFLVEQPGMSVDQAIELQKLVHAYNDVELDKPF